MSWAIEITGTASREIAKLDRAHQRRVVAFLRDRLAEKESPRRIGKALQGDPPGRWRYRVGDYRLVCRIDDENRIVRVLAVGHRREVYR